MEPISIILGSALLLILGGAAFVAYKWALANPRQPSFQESRTAAALSDRIDALEALCRSAMSGSRDAQDAAHAADALAKNVRDTLNGKLSGITRKQTDLESIFSQIVLQAQAQQQQTQQPGFPQSDLFDPNTRVR